MNTTGLVGRASLLVRLLVAAVCVTACAVTSWLADFVWDLLSANYDSPPTWYILLTLFLIALDIAAFCFIAFRAARVAMGRFAHGRFLRMTAVLLILLGASHAATGYAYTLIPQWDFPDGWFGDLSWRHTPGRISQECTVAGQSSGAGSKAEASRVPGVQRALSYKEVQQIARMDDWRVREEQLQDAVAVGWRGWIQDLSRHGYYDHPDRRIVKLFLDNPYSQAAASRDGWPEVELYFFESADAAKLSVGQEVLFCGGIAEATLHNGTTIVDIREPVVNPLPLPKRIATIQVPADFHIEYESHGCGDGYECPEYKLTIDAEGNVIYEGYDNVPVTGTHTISIPPDKLKQLVFELERTQFLSIDGLPDKLPSNPAGAVVISATAHGKDKTIVLPWRGTPWTNNIVMLIGKVEEVSELWRWVKMVT